MYNKIIGIGNTIVSDDGIGIYITNKLKAEYKNIDFDIVSYSGLYLIDHIVDYRNVVFIDSIRTGKNQIGNVSVFNIDDFETTSPFSLHSTDLLSAIDMGTKFGLNMPKNMFFLVIEVEDNYTFSESFTEKINLNLNNIYKNVKKELDLILRNKINP